MANKIITPALDHGVAGPFQISFSSIPAMPNDHNIKFDADQELRPFTFIIPPDSKNVRLAAVCLAQNKLYIQFLNGSEYMYSEIDESVLKHIFNIDSIGTFLHKYIVKKVPFRKVTQPLAIFYPNES